jgi:hypothetical protein
VKRPSLSGFAQSLQLPLLAAAGHAAERLAPDAR